VSSCFFWLIDGDAMPSDNHVEPVVSLMDDSDILGSVGIAMGSPFRRATLGRLHRVLLVGLDACFVHGPTRQSDLDRAVRAAALMTFGL
jgi:hypothetical protein